MPEIKPFIDTNILLYLLSEDNEKADRAEEIVHAGGRISVQVLNEFANVDSLVKSRFSDGAVKSSRSRLARFRRMQRTYPYVKF